MICHPTRGRRHCGAGDGLAGLAAMTSLAGAWFCGRAAAGAGVAARPGAAAASNDRPDRILPAASRRMHGEVAAAGRVATCSPVLTITSPALPDAAVAHRTPRHRLRVGTRLVPAQPRQDRRRCSMCSTPETLYAGPSRCGIRSCSTTATCRRSASTRWSSARSGGPGIDDRLERLFARGIDPGRIAGTSRSAVRRGPTRRPCEQFAREADACVLDALADAELDAAGPSAARRRRGRVHDPRARGDAPGDAALHVASAAARPEARAARISRRRRAGRASRAGRCRRSPPAGDAGRAPGAIAVRLGQRVPGRSRSTSPAFAIDGTT